MIALLFANPLFSKLALYGSILLAVLLLLLGFRKSGEKVGAMKVKLEAAHAVAVARKKMDEIPRPTRADVAKRLRDGTF